MADAQFDGPSGPAPSFGNGVYHEGEQDIASMKVSERDAAVQAIWLKAMKGMRLKKHLPDGKML